MTDRDDARAADRADYGHPDRLPPNDGAPARDPACRSDPDRLPDHVGDRDALRHVDRDAPGQGAHDQAIPEPGTEQTGAQRDLADHVDAVWDAIVRGAPPRSDVLAPELTAAARHLHRLDRSPPADPAFLARLREELTMPTPLPLPRPPTATRPAALLPMTPNGRAAVPPTTLPAPRRRPRRWWGAIERVVVAVLVLGLIGSYVALHEGAGGPGVEAEASCILLVDDNGQRFTPIDPETLRDLPAAGPLALDDASESGPRREYPVPDWRLSADGSTFVGFQWREPTNLLSDDHSRFATEDLTFIVRDGRDGRERVRFQPPAPVWNLFRMSKDGSRLLLQRGQILFRDNAPDLADPQEWYVVDTTDGRLVSTIVADEPGPLVGGYHDGWLSPDGDRVYRLITAGTPSASGPDPIRLVAHDAATGAAVGRLDLPDVRAGTWTADRRIAGRPVTQHDLVAHAFSPDGRSLALVHDGGTSVTVVDTDRFAIDRTVAVSPRSDPGQAFGRPASPEAFATEEDLPFDEGRVVWSVFSADGDGLYIGGWEGRFDEAGRHACRALETRRVDPETGTIVGRASSLNLTSPLLVPSDGASVYALDDQTEVCSFAFNRRQILRRLDTRTLDVLTERDLPGHVRIELAPSVVDGR